MGTGGGVGDEEKNNHAAIITITNPAIRMKDLRVMLVQQVDKKSGNVNSGTRH